MDILANPKHPDFPDVVVVVADASNLQRNLLLFTEISDLGIPSVLALNMLDVAASMNLTVNAVQLGDAAQCSCGADQCTNGGGINNLKEAVRQVAQSKDKPALRYFYEPKGNEIELIEEVKGLYQLDNDYVACNMFASTTIFHFWNSPFVPSWIH
jgi:ferrous iron transport protein B